jgi:hypothetical protein
MVAVGGAASLIVAVGVSALMMAGPRPLEPGFEGSDLLRLFGFVTLAFGGVGWLLFGLPLLWPGPAVVLDDVGLVVSVDPFGPVRVRWSEVASANTREVAEASTVLVDLVDEHAFIGGLSLPARLLGRLRSWNGLTPVVIPRDFVACRVDVLAERIRAEAAARRAAP